MNDNQFLQLMRSHMSDMNPDMKREMTKREMWLVFWEVVACVALLVGLFALGCLRG